MSIEYAIHGLVYLARSPSDKSILLATIASVIQVPREYMRKIFQMLTKSRIVTAQRGAKGGYRLARSASEITLKDVIEAIDGSLPIYSCLKDRRNCKLGKYCPVKKSFDEASRKMSEVLEGTSIQDVTNKIMGRNAELSWLKVTA